MRYWADHLLSFLLSRRSLFGLNKFLLMAALRDLGATSVMVRPVAVHFFYLCARQEFNAERLML